MSTEDSKPATKTSEGYVPGPWEAGVEYDSDVFAGDLQLADCDFPQGELTEGVIRANARLMAAAPAMELVLALISHGLARIERVGSLVEFCFDGLRYINHGDWNATLGVIGWDKARDAIAKAK